MSNNDSWTDPQNESPVPVKKKGMSGCMLAGLIIGGLGAVCGLVCCGGAVWLGVTFAPKVSKEPAEVLASARQILNVEMIEGFSPDNSVTMDNFIFTMRIAQFRHKEGKGGMMMGSMKIKVGDPNMSNNQTRDFRTKFENEELGNIDIKTTETRDIIINGQKASVKIGEGTDRRSNKPVHTVSAEFEQPSGNTFLLLHMDDEIWNEEAVLKMLEEAKPE